VQESGDEGLSTDGVISAVGCAVRVRTERPARAERAELCARTDAHGGLSSCRMVSRRGTVSLAPWYPFYPTGPELGIPIPTCSGHSCWQVRKDYLAVCAGRAPSDVFSIDLPIVDEQSAAMRPRG
jgi:hypothetical protein